MERGGKRARSEKGTRRSLLDLARFIPQRDVRRLVWQHCTAEDVELVWCAQNRRRPLPAFDAETLIAYARAGHTALLEWALAEREQLGANQLPDWIAETMMEAAARHGHMGVIQWLEAAIAPATNIARCLQKAARGGHLNIIEYLYTGVYIRSMVCAYAARGGHTCVMEWALQKDPTMIHGNCIVCYYAALYGQLEALKWARARGFPWDERVRQHATGETLQWAIANGAP